MRILYYSPGWPIENFSNGIVSYVDRMIPALKDRGVDAQVLTGVCQGDVGQGVYTLDDGAGIQRSCVSLASRILYRFTPSRARDLEFGMRLYLAGLRLRRMGANFDLLEMEETFGVATALSGGLNVPLLIRLHGPAFLNEAANGTQLSGRVLQQIQNEGRAIRRSIAVSAPSLDVLEQVRTHYGLSSLLGRVIPNPGPAVMRETVWDPRRALNQHILFIGRFDLHKGGDVVVKAFAQVLQKHPNAKLTFAGEDRGISCGDVRLDFDSFVKTSLGELGSRIEFLGRVPNSKLAELRMKSTLVVHPSRYEVFGIAALEALAQGMPTIATNIGGYRETIKHGTTGLLVEPGDPGSLAQGICTLLDNPGFAASMGEAALKDYEQRFTPAIVAKASHEFYQEVIEGNRG